LSPPENTNVAGRALLLGGNVLSRWTHVFSSRFDTSLQFYFDNYDRDVPQLDEFRDTFDLDFQNHFAFGTRQDLPAMNLHTDPTSLDMVSVANTEGSNPNHQAQVRSHIELPRGFSRDANAYFVDSLPVQPTPSYTRLDSQVRWRLGERIELNLVGQNLLQDHHLEFNDFLQAVNS
jgi:hypothetical protein